MRNVHYPHTTRIFGGKNIERFSLGPEKSGMCFKTRTSWCNEMAQNAPSLQQDHSCEGTGLGVSALQKQWGWFSENMAKVVLQSAPIYIIV